MSVTMFVVLESFLAFSVKYENTAVQIGWTQN